MLLLRYVKTCVSNICGTSVAVTKNICGTSVAVTKKLNLKRHYDSYRGNLNQLLGQVSQDKSNVLKQKRPCTCKDSTFSK